MVIGMVAHVCGMDWMRCAGAQVLRVTLHDAQHVMAADMNGKSDPYVRMKVVPDQGVGPQEFKSSHKGATLNPSWVSGYVDDGSWLLGSRRLWWVRNRRSDSTS